MKMPKLAFNLIAGDGQTNVLHLNTLDYELWDEVTNQEHWQNVYFDGFKRLKKLRPKGSQDYREFQFDVLMANPPFAGDIKEPRMISRYDLAKKPDGKWQTKVGRDILFIERNLDFLKPGGRMAIVLPQGRFNNSSDKNIRDFIADRCRILAVVGLHGNTFCQNCKFKKTDCKTILVPILSQQFQDSIKNIFKYSIYLLDSSKDIYQQAEDLLLSELGLKYWQPTEETIAVKSFSNSFLSSGRLDAEYYQPKYDQLITQIEKKSRYVKRISEIQIFNSRGLQPIYSETGKLDKQQQIVNNYSLSLDYQNKSKQLLEIAKIGVEKAIECDEAIATEWINQQLEQLGVTNKSKQLLEIAKIGVEKAIECDEAIATEWINQQLEQLGGTNS